VINIWKYADAENIRIVSTSGNIYTGNVLSIDDAEEMDNAKEDEINIETSDGKVICLKPSEIQNIEQLQ
jgi:hypothetical protein